MPCIMKTTWTNSFQTGTSSRSLSPVSGHFYWKCKFRQNLVFPKRKNLSHRDEQQNPLHRSIGYAELLFPNETVHFCSRFSSRPITAQTYAERRPWSTYTEILPSRKFVLPIKQLMRTLFRCFWFTSIACRNTFVISPSFVRSSR